MQTECCRIGFEVRIDWGEAGLCDWMLVAFLFACYYWILNSLLLNSNFRKEYNVTNHTDRTQIPSFCHSLITWTWRKINPRSQLLLESNFRVILPFISNQGWAGYSDKNPFWSTLFRSIPVWAGHRDKNLFFDQLEWDSYSDRTAQLFSDRLKGDLIMEI